MSVGAWGRTWEDASTPSAARLTRRYERAWRDAQASGSRPDPRLFLAGWSEPGGFPGARLALLRTDMSLRWEAGQQPSADWYVAHFPELDQDTIVALIYEEFCLREEAGEAPEAAAFLGRYPSYAEPLRRVLDIHTLVGGASTSNFTEGSTSGGAAESADEPASKPRFPEAGDAIAGFQLVEELGRGSFARVFLARETQLADRLVALKLSLRGSREPQTLARLQHTHIVPVHSHRVDSATGLHLLCMPYFGRVTLARVLAEVERASGGEPPTGPALVAALDRLEPPDGAPSGPSTGRQALASRSFPRALAWWGSRLAEALGHAHDRGVLHRDVKPSNVLVAADGTPMLLDFNLAHEVVLPGDADKAGASLGGTVDYMAPEHLEALAEGRGDHVDARSDVFSMGVMLYEAVVGEKPFAPPRKTGSIVEALLRAADERREPRGLFPAGSSVPAPFRSVLERCLAPAPADRYQSAEELALDLQAVADDLPLAFAREPVWSRLARRLRRNRLRFATAALILLSCAAAGAAAINLGIERSDRYAQARRRLEGGDDLMRKRDFDKAVVQFEAALQFAEGPDQGFLDRVFDWRNIRDLAERARVRLAEPDAHSDLERLEELAKEKKALADRSATKRREAQAIHDASEGLRMRFVGIGEDRAGATEELQVLLKPFYVLGQKDWTQLDHNLDMLDPAELDRLRSEVNELLFLWMVGVESALPAAGSADAPAREKSVAAAIEVCDKALRFVTPAGPWLELRSRFQARLADQDDPESAGGDVTAEPQVGDERSALACFQWGILHSSRRESGRAISWLQRAVRIDWSNYWYQFYLGYLEDEEGAEDEALYQYSVAAAVKPESPWVLFSRARIYRKKGRWTWALEDLQRSLELMGPRPEALKVRLEMGYVHQALGDFPRARAQYHEVVKADPTDELGRAARLNLANLDAESGDVDRARAGYAEVLALDPDDSAARLSRSLLDLREGRPASAAEALDGLIPRERRTAARSDLLATRSVVRMMLDRDDEAVVDALEARRLDPTPARDRLVERALLAAGRDDELQLDRPEELVLFPFGAAPLRADLEAAERRLAESARGRPGVVYRAQSTRAVILSALGRHREAALAAREAIAASNQNSPEAHLIAARVAHRAGDRAWALQEVELGLRLDPGDPGLLEIRGALRAEGGDAQAALPDLELAIARSGGTFAHTRKAEALRRLGRLEEAVHEWTLTLRRDPETAAGYLGRARCYLDLSPPQIESALVDLEQAASWSRNDAETEVGVLVAYAHCLRERPDRFPRWLSLLRRSIGRLGTIAMPWVDRHDDVLAD
ncbi:serine/threonine-protein kinase [Planctomyces sp. SH-PL62]|uniref:serine/threonine-protein kinase n=1 Tax=Planctomyces sp. SH-PL62 TaxID=1636152 RepID=UPI00078C4931|nr:serine/threonine-protein kinase [Planctomyces sp. SH-PL62]AMV37196.1 Serine/threonine-protein kinase PknB [Planctomyces sp. SH-PL62]